MTQTAPAFPDLLQIHQLLLPAARCLCPSGDAIVLRLAAQSKSLHQRLSVLRLPKDGAPARPASLDSLLHWLPQTKTARLREWFSRRRYAPEPTHALTSLHRVVGLLAAHDGSALAVADAGHAAIVLWRETHSQISWRFSTSTDQLHLPRQRALATNTAAATLALTFARHQQGPHSLPSGAIVFLNGNGPSPPTTAHGRLQYQALWTTIRQDPDAFGALLVLLANHPTVLLATSGQEPHAIRLVALLDDLLHEFIPLFLGPC